MLANVPQSLILVALLFLIYINDFLDDLESSVKLFANDTLLFSTVYGPIVLADQLDKENKKNDGHRSGK